MQKQNLNDMIEFDESRFRPRVLINDPGYRMVLLTMRAGQAVPEHATTGRVMVYVIRGHVNFYEDETLCDLRQGGVVSLAAGAKHRVEALDDSVLLVLATDVFNSANVRKNNSRIEQVEELDLREVPRPQRHPMIFAKFDALGVGESFRLLNDHDPIPLNRQFDSVRPGEASWEYIERGPELFRVHIQRIAAHIPLGMA